MKFSDLQRAKLNVDPLARFRGRREAPPPVSFVPLGRLAAAPSGDNLPMTRRASEHASPIALPEFSPRSG
ncbi:MAG: hypothetical protein U0791_24295 [Gemmataceae bacterium]